MGIVFMVGTGFGAIAGIIHASFILIRHPAISGPSSTATVVWRALWALVLWTAVGGYLLIMWILAIVLRALIGRKSPAPETS